MNLSTPRIIAIFKHALFELQKPKITKKKPNTTHKATTTKQKQTELENRKNKSEWKKVPDSRELKVKL